jgi:hypothetical protein
MNKTEIISEAEFQGATVTEGLFASPAAGVPGHFCLVTFGTTFEFTAASGAVSRKWAKVPLLLHFCQAFPNFASLSFFTFGSLLLHFCQREHP